MSRFGIVLTLLLSSPLWAEKLDKSSQAWLDSVRVLLTRDEEKTFKSLKEKSDRDEFQKIFWARRNPRGPDKEENEYRVAFEKAKGEADTRFKGRGKTVGSETDCGRAFLIIGEPNDTKKTRDGEVWTFRDRPGFTFPDGHVDITFDQYCTLPEGSRLEEFLVKAAAAKIVSPNIAFKVGSDGHLTKLQDLLPKPTPVQALFKGPREDFQGAGEATLFLKMPDGADYLAGLVRCDASGLTVTPVGDKKTVRVAVASQAFDEGGRKASGQEREVDAIVEKDGSFSVSYGLALKAGTYSVKVGVFEPKSSKGTVVTVPAKVPDLLGDLTLASLTILRDIEENPPTDPLDPLVSFSLDKTRLVPRFGNVFNPSESINIFYAVYNAKVDPSTQKASVAVTLSISKDGQVMAKAAEQVYETQDVSHSLGPLALGRYTPGKYVLEIKVKDGVAKKDLTHQATFEVRAP